MDGKNKMSEFELFFHSKNKFFREIFSDDFADKFERYLGTRKLFFDVIMKYQEQVAPKLRGLMMKQYSDFALLTHTAQLQWIKDVTETSASALAWQMDYVCTQYKQGVDLGKKYPKLDEWREFYCNPARPKTLDNKYRKYRPTMSDEEWKKYKEEEDKKMLEFHEWEQNRLTEYYDIVQPALFKIMPALNDIEGDFWVIYATELRDNYEVYWKSPCERLEIIIDYQMPPQSIELSDDHFDKALQERFEQYHRKAETKRDARIHGA